MQHSKTRMSTGKESADDGCSASRLSKAAHFFPTSSSGGLGEAVTLEGQVKSNRHRLCEVIGHSYL